MNEAIDEWCNDTAFASTVERLGVALADGVTVTGVEGADVLRCPQMSGI